MIFSIYLSIQCIYVFIFFINRFIFYFFKNFIYLFLHFLFFMLEIVWYFLPVGEIYLEFLCYYNTIVYMFCSFYLILYITWFQFSLSLSPFYYFDYYEHQYFTSVLFHMFSLIKNALFGSCSWMSHRTFIESSVVTTAFWLDQYGGRFASIFRRCPPSMFWGQWAKLDIKRRSNVLYGKQNCAVLWRYSLFFLQLAIYHDLTKIKTQHSALCW